MNLREDIKLLAVPIGLIILTFGIFANAIGIYGDSWVVNYGMSLGYDGASEFLSSEKPLSTWLWYFYFKVGGYNPFIWNLMFTMIRIFLAITLYYLSKEIFKNPIIAIIFSCLFTLYPGFSQYSLTQIYLLNFTLIWFVYLSFYLMLLFFKSGKLWQISISLVLSVLNYISMDYYLGIELTRYFILFLFIRSNGYSIDQNRKKIRNLILIYIIPILLFVFWRLFIFKTNRVISNQTEIIKDILNHPFSEIGKRLEFFVTDFIESIVLAWNQSINAELFNFDSKTNLLALIILLSIPVIIYFYLMSFQSIRTKEQSNWSNKLFLSISVLCFVSGLAPVWFANREINLINYQLIGNVATTDRYMLPGLFAIIMIDIIILLQLLRNFKSFILISSILIGIAATFQFKNSLIYKNYNSDHNDFLSQLKIRAPFIEPQTCIFVFGKNNIFPKNSNTIGLPVNMMYDSVFKTHLNYYAYNISSKFEIHNLEKLKDSIILDTCLTLEFKGKSGNILFVNYNSGEALRVIDSLSINELPFLDPLARNYHFLSNNAVIKDAKVNSNEGLLNLNNQLNWVNLFQMADLARQKGDTGKIISIGNQIIKLKLKPSNASESVIFLETFINSNDYIKAGYFYNLAKQNQRNNYEIEFLLKKYKYLFK